MELSYLKNFFSSYSLATVLIAVLSAVIVLVVNKFWKNMPRLVRVYAPIVLALILEFSYDIIFVSHKFIFTVEAFSTGVISGSLATLFIAFINKYKSGEDFELDATVILIDELLGGYLSGKNRKLALSAITAILGDSNISEDKKRLDEVCAVIKKYSADGFSQAEILALSELIIQTAKSIRQD